jgi:poly(A) polymerase
MRQSTLRRLLGKANLGDHLELHRVDCLSSHRNLDNYWFCRKQLEKMKDEPPTPPRLVTGRDLIEMGYEPGPIFAEILDAVEDQQLGGTLQTRADAMIFVRRTFPTPGKKVTGG